MSGTSRAKAAAVKREKASDEQPPKEAGIEVDRFRQALKEQRMPPEYPPILAVNIGRWSKLLSPIKPSDGAKALFKAAFPKEWAAKWRKRQRLVRLPDEEAPPKERGGEYESSGENYLLLAEAFAEIYSGPGRFGRADAARMLLQGTALYPRETGTGSDQELLCEVLAKIESKAFGGVVQEAFRVMTQAPIDVVDGNIVFTPEANSTIWPGVTAERGPSWDRPFPAWWFGHVPIGKVYIPVRMPVLWVGRHASSELFDNIKSTESAIIEQKAGLYSELGKNLEEMIGHFIMSNETASSYIIDNYFDCDDPYGSDTIIWVCGDINAYVSPSDCDARPELGFSLSSPSEKYDGINEFIGCQHFSIHIQDDDGKFIAADQWEPNFDAIEFEEGSYASPVCAAIDNNGVYVLPQGDKIWDHISNNEGYTTGLFPGLKPYAWDDVLDLLMGRGLPTPIFEPFIWDDPTRIVPVAHRSPAATLMRNALFAPEEERLAYKLRALLGANAELVVRYFEDKMREFEFASTEELES